MSQSVELTQEMANILARAFFPKIRGYVDAHPEEYAAFLKQWNEQHEEDAERVASCT